jgi:integrase
MISGPTLSGQPGKAVGHAVGKLTLRHDLAQRNGIRSTRFHALRHYSATELLSSGVDLRTAAGRLGHGTGATTLRFYAAWVNEAAWRRSGRPPIEVDQAHTS